MSASTHLEIYGSNGINLLGEETLRSDSLKASVTVANMRQDVLGMQKCKVVGHR